MQKIQNRDMRQLITTRHIAVGLAKIRLKTCLLFIAIVYSHTSFANTTLTFCYQDTAIAPYYLGDGHKVQTERPGATIEHLQKIAAKVPHLTLKLVRYPWNRCLRYLKTGEVDAVVANYSDDRRELGAFPMRHNKPDPRREFTQQEICLVTSKELAKKWNGSSFNGLSKVTLAHQSGRSLQKSLPHRQFIKTPISAQAKALQMLAQHKVQAVTVVCKIAGKNALTESFDPTTMQQLQPNIEMLHGHLVFSHQFYKNQQSVAEALWAQLTETPLEIYLKYLNDPQ